MMVTVLRVNGDIPCWEGEQLTYALQGMIGMSLFVPLAVLSFGSYQVFFPELKLDVQTSPRLNMSSQILKAVMTATFTCYDDQVVRTHVYVGSFHPHEPQTHLEMHTLLETGSHPQRRFAWELVAVPARGPQPHCVLFLVRPCLLLLLS